MPVKIKLFISLLALVVVGGFSYTNLDGIHDRIGYVGFALACFMVLAMWIFPETGQVKRKDGNHGAA